MNRDPVLMPWLGSAALIGGLLWVFKAVAILLGHAQPEHAFEVAPLLFALVTLGLASWVPPSRARRVGIALAVTALLGCLVAAVSSVVTGNVLGPDLALGMVTMTVALAISGLALLRSGAAVGAFPLLLGLATIPATLVGGALSTVDERLLEAPILAIGLGWIFLGVALLRLIGASPRAT